MLRALTILAFAGLLSPALASGTIPYSLSQQLDQYGKPLTGCRLYVIQAGTTSTPQNAYQDAALTIPTANPMVCDSSGRLPQFFLADGTIKVRLTDKNGSPQVVADGIQVIGPSGGGGGGGGSVDPTTVLQTGDVKIRYGSGLHAGFVRQNGRTIGSASSGASERANSDCQALFEYLWNTDPALAVSGGRGGSSLSDWTANKTITLPDARGRNIAAMDDMGSSPAGRLNLSASGCNAIVLGASCGTQNQSLTQAQLPNVGMTVQVSGTINVTTTRNDILFGVGTYGAQGGGASIPIPSGAFGNVTSTGPTTLNGYTSSINGGVSQAGLVMVPPMLVMTIYQKL